MLLVPDADLSHAWQENNEKKSEDLYKLGRGTYLYATDNLAAPRESEATWPAGKEPAAPDMQVFVARVQVGDDWDPEPYAWRRMARVMADTSHVEVRIDRIKLGVATLAGHTLAHLTGTQRFVLTPAQRDELKTFIDHGGLLLVDAAGGSVDFADSAQQELARIFGDEASQLAQRFPIDALTQNLPKAMSLERFVSQIRSRSHGRRRPRFASFRHPPQRTTRRHLQHRGSHRRDREDQVDGILGYDVPSSTAIVGDIILYASLPRLPNLDGMHPRHSLAITLRFDLGRCMQAVIFDMDGLMIDSEKIYWAVGRRWPANLARPQQTKRSAG